MRDPLVTPAVGDVIEGEEGGDVVTLTVDSVRHGMVYLVGGVCLLGGHRHDVDEVAVELEDWPEWCRADGVRVVSVARDPLTDPAPGDVVRAKSGGILGTIVVLDVAGDLIGYVVCWPGYRQATVYEETLDERRDWSEWTDVAVLS